MDHTLRNPAAGRHEDAHNAGNDPATPRDSTGANPGTAPATKPVDLTPTAAGFRIRFCTWCKQIDIRGPRRDSDVISILIIGKIVLAAWNGKVMMVQDGICEACSEELHPRKPAP